jgi:cadmium resistance transport/sequestration family protein
MVEFKDILMETLIILTAISAFVSTNLDDMFLLVAFFANPEFKAKDVVLGQYLGFIVLLTVSSLAYFVQFIIPSNWISLLGVIPIMIGIRSLLHLKKTQTDDSGEKRNFSKYKEGQKMLPVTLVTLANGGDNLGVYMPLFASMDLFDLFLTATTFLIMVGVWCFLGYKLVNNRVLGNKIKNYGHYILPFIMIVIGLVIILRGWF